MLDITKKNDYLYINNIPNKIFHKIYIHDISDLIAYKIIVDKKIIDIDNGYTNQDGETFYKIIIETKNNYNDVSLYYDTLGEIKKDLKLIRGLIKEFNQEHQKQIIAQLEYQTI